ncbi:MAG: hypothetical protein OEY17_07110 [Nitrosopumilus sp.]|nr:hypothetical protein [Nitrosopumilus sp.]MDH5659094.1 hypothetical protein [Nitrosopumilus sp.]
MITEVWNSIAITGDMKTLPYVVIYESVYPHIANLSKTTVLS